jgi:regulator of protease activity HflC (stomatin/prohibitin superfamily)
MEMISIEYGTIGIKKRRGVPSEVLYPGFHFYIPILETVDVISTGITLGSCREEIVCRDGIPIQVSVDIYYQIYDPLVAYSAGRPEPKLDKIVWDILRPYIESRMLVELVYVAPVEKVISSAIRKSIVNDGFTLLRLNMSCTIKGTSSTDI